MFSSDRLSRLMGEMRSAACERARVWAALLPDGELSQFERRILEVHLARCADCARHAEQVAAIVAVVRDTPSESPRIHIRVSARRRFANARLAKLAVGGSAAVAAVVALSISTSISRPHQPEQPAAPLIVIGSPQGANEEAILWRETQAQKRSLVVRQSSARFPGPLLS